jgi:Fe(3+) dicitrate transport protein
MPTLPRTLLSLSIAALCTPAFADDAAELDRVVVVGTKERAATQPGSAQVLDQTDLESARVLSVGEALRKVPGVVVRDEEGFGLRPNIGIRGLNPTRSTKVLLLEDGLPFAFAPYGDNASYFHPPIERYERIEVLKGSGMLRFGPQTIGGVINYITPEPPQDFEGEIDAAVGTEGYRRLRVALGAGGHRFDAMAKEGDGARDNQSLRQGDFNYKFSTRLGEAQSLTLRATYLREDSQVTYSGLTDAEYRAFGARYNPFKNDRFDLERFGASATWGLALGDSASLSANAYYYEFHRDWGRQSSSTTDGQCGAAFTNARLAGQAVDVDACNSRQMRNRDFTTWGIEPRLRATYSLGAVQGELEAGVRLHRERQARLQLNGTTPTATTGALVEHNLRDVDAWSAFVENRFEFGRLAVVPAVRFESMEFTRENRLGAGARGAERVSEWVPGIGATFEASPSVQVFAGVHEGFAPPRVEDLIGNTGTVVAVDAERSRNAELGVRGRMGRLVSFEVAAFDNDFDNQIAVGSIASGSTPLAQGQARYRGLEAAARATFDATGPGQPYVQLAYTALAVAEQSSALVRVDNGQAVAGSAAGRRMPYAPRHTGSLRMGYVVGGWDMAVEGVYTSRQFADFANTVSAPINGNGQVGALDATALVNLAVNYAVGDSGWTVYGTVKNATDRTYIADRTRGILPGAGRQVVLGASYRF